jgi:hypothetical protein
MRQISAEKISSSSDSSIVFGSEASLIAAQGNRPVIVLAGVAITSVLLYLFVFVYPYNIFRAIFPASVGGVSFCPG